VSTILVTGGTGTLGRVLVEQLVARDHDVRVLSRRAAPAETGGATWVTGNLRTDDGIGAAVSGVDVIVHCASTTRGDVESSRHLIDAAERGQRPHLVYISIVGVDRVPLGYYRSKVESEHLIEGSGLPWTILRATQFHDLILRGCRALGRLPVMMVPADTDFQPIEVGEVARSLLALAEGPAAGRVPDMGGPAIRTTRQLAQMYLAAAGRHRRIVALRLPGSVFAGYRRGDHLAPQHAVGRVTFEQYLAERFPGSSGEAEPS
jgi:uncharacterized protein YbjT (DUF2867 family)